MGIGGLWGIYTLILFGIFLVIVVWAWSKKRRRGFEEAAHLPLIEDQEVTHNKRPGTKEADS